MRRDAVAAQWLIKAARKEGSSLVWFKAPPTRTTIGTTAGH